MTTKDFVWDSATWTQNYVSVFESFKKDIANSFTLFHPNYELKWYLYVDASDAAVGGVLIQVKEDGEQQVVAFVSKKFSSSSIRWSTIEKEAFSMFYACMKLKYYLFAKQFTMLTDHNNLLWMEASEVPKIIRMRIYLQEFNFNLIHIPGKSNVFADWLSRMYDVSESVSMESATLLAVWADSTFTAPAQDAVSTTIASVHNPRMGHHGAFRTWLLLNKHCPGHGIPMQIVQDFVRECAFCQKVRSTVNDSLQAPTRAIVSEHPRQLCGYDTLYVTPADAEGFMYLHVFKLMPSRMVALYPSKTLSAESLASAAFQFFVTYGITDVLITDPGSNITSEVLRLLLNWFGVRLRVSLVGRHQSNGVERTHREVLRFLTILVNSERVKGSWSKPHVLGIIQFLLNSEISAETGLTPFQYIFGTVDATYFTLPDLPIETHGEYLRMLNTDLLQIREAAQQIQREEQQKRISDVALNSYAVGDLVLFDEASKGFRDQKLKFRYAGPYMVTSVYKADITCKHVVTSKVKVFHMQDLKPFMGSLHDAYQAAKTDDDQYVIISIIDYSGDPLKRSSMEFCVLFEGEDKLWLRYNPDLSASSQFQLYIRSHPELEPLIMSADDWRTKSAEYNRLGIIGVNPGQVCFVNLKSWGAEYFRSLNLPLGMTYVVQCQYIKWTTPRRKKIDMHCSLFSQRFEWDATSTRLYGMFSHLRSDMVLVDENFCQQHPKVLE